MTLTHYIPRGHRDWSIWIPSFPCGLRAYLSQDKYLDAMRNHVWITDAFPDDPILGDGEVTDDESAATCMGCLVGRAGRI